MKTTLNKIKEHELRQDGWEKLLKHLGKTEGDNEPLSLITILDSNGLDDALWCLRAVDGNEREMRLFSVWCARQVQHLMTEPSIAALDVAERFANGLATETELTTAVNDAGDAAVNDAGNAARAATWAAAWAAAVNAARAARAAARAAAVAAAVDAAVNDAVNAAAVDAAVDAVVDAAGNAAAWAAVDAAVNAAGNATAWAAWAAGAAGAAAAWASQEVEFRRICTATKGVQDD
jgi:hypothetical protein